MPKCHYRSSVGPSSILPGVRSLVWPGSVTLPYTMVADADSTKAEKLSNASGISLCRR